MYSLSPSLSLAFFFSFLSLSSTLSPSLNFFELPKKRKKIKINCAYILMKLTDANPIVIFFSRIHDQCAVCRAARHWIPHQSLERRLLLLPQRPSPSKAHALRHDVFFFPPLPKYFCPALISPAHTLPPGPPSQHKCACWDSRSREIDVPRHESPRSVPNFLGFSGPGCGSPTTGQTAAMRVLKVAKPKCNLMTVGSAGFY